MVNGIPDFHNVHLDRDGCELGKIHMEEFPLIADRKKRDILELLHTDVFGPMQTRSLGGSYYFYFLLMSALYSLAYMLSAKRARHFNASNN